MLKIKRLSEVIGRRVFTDAGDLFGLVEEINIIDNRIDGWRIVVARESGMMQVTCLVLLRKSILLIIVLMVGELLLLESLE